MAYAQVLKFENLMKVFYEYIFSIANHSFKEKITLHEYLVIV